MKSYLQTWRTTPYEISSTKKYLTSSDSLDLYETCIIALDRIRTRQGNQETLGNIVLETAAVSEGRILFHYIREILFLDYLGKMS